MVKKDFKTSVLNVSFRIANVFTWFTILKAPYQDFLLSLLSHPSVVLENSVALVVMEYVGA